MKRTRLQGLVAAVHTPFLADGSLNLAMVQKQAEHLLSNAVETVFICGSTGECHSLGCDERRQLAERWMAVTRGARIQVVVHVGSNALVDARALAAHAAALGVPAVAALAPSYFKPGDLSTLIECCAEIADAAPETPFYFYDIPSLTGVSFPMPEFLERANERIPTLNGIKFTNTDMMAYQRCLRVARGAFDLPWGVDEMLLGALALGATGAVGSSYNFASPIYSRLLRAFADGDLAGARDEQFRSVSLIRTLAGYGYMAAAKALMKLLGVDVGPPRLPHAALSEHKVKSLRGELETAGFFDWLRAPVPSASGGLEAPGRAILG